MIPVRGVTIPANLDLDQVTNCNRKTYRGVVTIPALDPDLELDFQIVKVIPDPDVDPVKSIYKGVDDSGLGSGSKVRFSAFWRFWIEIP